ncbi:unnamed protein product [Effrenium voratum]|nr:unnamed protein product [Effrenium voratum]
MASLIAVPGIVSRSLGRTPSPLRAVGHSKAPAPARDFDVTPDTTDVIYAEDEEVFRETAVRELLKVGFLRRVSALSAARVENAERTGPTKDGQPSSADTGLGALEHLAQMQNEGHITKPLLVLLDVRMPGMDGRECALQIQELVKQQLLRREPYVVCISSIARQVEMDEGGGNFQIVLPKPITAQYIEDAFEHLRQWWTLGYGRQLPAWKNFRAEEIAAWPVCRMSSQMAFTQAGVQSEAVIEVDSEEPHLIEQADEAIPGTRYLWRVGGNSEFQLPLADGELYEKRLPYQIAEWYAEFERKGGILYPPPHTYIYYQNKVGLARLFNERKVKIPPTWVFESLSEAEAELENIKFPVVIKDPYGFSSMHLLQAADKEEFLQNCQLYFEKALPGVEAIVQSKVVAMREARVTYIEGRPFHGYWRIRQSLKSASAASNLGGYQDFDFPLSEIAPYVAEFANLTGIPVGGVDFIWEEEKANVTVVPYTLEVSPTSDINPPAPTSWTKTYSEFKHTKGYRRAYLDVRRSWRWP